MANTTDTKTARKAPKPFNGHPSYAKWNVFLYLSNESGLYFTAVNMYKDGYTKHDVAVKLLKHTLLERTPDGVRYSYSNVRYALSLILEGIERTHHSRYAAKNPKTWPKFH